MESKRKYPLILFIFGVIGNLIRTFYIGALMFLFLIIGIFNNNFLKLSGVILCIWIIYAVIDQIKIRKVSLNKSSNEQYNQVMDLMLGKNGPFSKSENKVDIDKMLEDIAKNNHNSNDAT